MLKCSKEAFAVCPTRHLCGSPEEATFTEGSECDKFNRQIGSHTMTNADRIRAMSDEELADWLDSFGGDFFCLSKAECAKLINADQDIPDERRKQCVMDWLKQPVKEEPT